MENWAHLEDGGEALGLFNLVEMAGPLIPIPFENRTGLNTGVVVAATAAQSSIASLGLERERSEKTAEVFGGGVVEFKSLVEVVVGIG